MKKKFIRYTLSVISIFILIIIYLSVVGLETDKFNNQIKNKAYQVNKKLKIEIKKIKLTLDPFNLKINAKTIGANISYQGKNLELEYIKTQISLISLIRDKFVSSNLELSTKSIQLKDLVTFVRLATNKPELFILESAVKRGSVIADIILNFDENGKIKQDYKFKGILKDGKIKLFKGYNFEKINFLLDVRNNIFNLNDINLKLNKIDLFSDNLKITQNNKNFVIEGDLQNKNSYLNKELLKVLNLNIENFPFLNTYFTSKNNFSFNVNNKLKIKNLIVSSEIHVKNSEYQKPVFFNDYFPESSEIIYIKDHNIKINYKEENFTAEGVGKIKLEKKFDEIKYKISAKEKFFNLTSDVNLSELKFKNQKFIKYFFPKSNEIIDLKNQQLEINYSKNNLSVKGSGKIKLENAFDNIDFFISKINDNFIFDSQINLNKTLLFLDFFNFKTSDKLETKLKIKGDYNPKNEINFKEINIKEKDNKIILNNLSLSKDYLVIKADKMDLDYFDTENKKNQLLLLRKKKNDYKISGSIFNANRLIYNLLKSKSNSNTKILKNDINLSLDLDKVYIYNEDIVRNLNGKLEIKDNKVFQTDISAFFDKDEKLTFTINNNEGEKVTTLFSARAKPLVARYDFVKGFQEGYLDFFSSKKNNISSSKLKIYNFKLLKLPVLTKLLSLASLQGIADTLSGEGIRFNEFEMNFSNENDTMKIGEIYAIGPAISILMSGYIEEDKLISLRGTLVPATTINKSIGSIPILGKILVGDKTGEGVFGVSFKIKGPPKNLETSVNPIKTLTPRFITRTLEKIKKN